MPEEFKQSKLPEGSFGEYFVLEGLINFFDGYQLFALGLALFILRVDYDSISPLADWNKEYNYSHQ